MILTFSKPNRNIRQGSILEGQVVSDVITYMEKQYEDFSL